MLDLCVYLIHLRNIDIDHLDLLFPTVGLSLDFSLSLRSDLCSDIARFSPHRLKRPFLLSDQSFGNPYSRLISRLALNHFACKDLLIGLQDCIRPAKDGLIEFRVVSNQIFSPVL